MEKGERASTRYAKIRHGIELKRSQEHTQLAITLGMILERLEGEREGKNAPVNRKKKTRNKRNKTIHGGDGARGLVASPNSLYDVSETVRICNLHKWYLGYISGWREIRRH